MIASMLLSDVGLKTYTDTAYHNEGVKSLTRYRFDKVQERAKLKRSVYRFVCILSLKLKKLVSTLHIASVYALLEEMPGANQVADANLTCLKNLLSTASKDHYGREKAIGIRDTARDSIGSWIPAKSLELRHAIRPIQGLSREINDIEAEIGKIMNEPQSLITTILGVGI